jgi:hypothetical protein
MARNSGMQETGVTTEMTEMTAMLSTGTSSRRSALRLLGVGALGAALTGIGLGEAEAKKSKKRKKKGKTHRGNLPSGAATSVANPVPPPSTEELLEMIAKYIGG